jgi:hypothetical protein
VQNIQMTRPITFQPIPGFPDDEAVLAGAERIGTLKRGKERGYSMKLSGIYWLTPSNRPTTVRGNVACICNTKDDAKRRAELALHLIFSDESERPSSTSAPPPER